MRSPIKENCPHKNTFILYDILRKHNAVFCWPLFGIYFLYLDILLDRFSSDFSSHDFCYSAKTESKVRTYVRAYECSVCVFCVSERDYVSVSDYEGGREGGRGRGRVRWMEGGSEREREMNGGREREGERDEWREGESDIENLNWRL